MEYLQVYYRQQQKRKYLYIITLLLFTLILGYSFTTIGMEGVGWE